MSKPKANRLDTFVACLDVLAAACWDDAAAVVKMLDSMRTAGELRPLVDTHSDDAARDTTVVKPTVKNKKDEDT